MVIMAYQAAIAGTNPDEHLKKHKALYSSRIEKADKKLNAAQKTREKEVLDATKKYIKENRRGSFVSYFETNDFERAMEIAMSVYKTKRGNGKANNGKNNFYRFRLR